MIDDNDPLIKKIKAKIINQSPRYPKDGPHLNLGEKIKFERLFNEFKL